MGLSWRTPIRQFYQFWIEHTVSAYDPANLSKSAIVFSPHPDDETLGCGGTIIRKNQAGAAVKIVFMTDGSQSHAHLLSQEQLKLIRAEEAIAAAQVLGLEPADVIALNFPDGSLQTVAAEAVQAVVALLQTHQPDEVFVPHRFEPPADHAVTNQIVWQAIQQTKQPVTVYEYPIWLWDQYPWTTLILKPGFWTKLRATIGSGLGWGLIRELSCAVEIRDLLELKQKALNQHRSQMQPLIAGSQWLTLGDLSNGEFLNCFFQNYEFFRLIKANQRHRP